MNTKNLRINYHIEIINDEKTWDKLIRVTENYKKYHIEPWELYTNKDFDTFEKALAFYMTWYISNQCYDIKMWEQIFKDDEMIYEEYVEPCSTTRSTMRSMLNRDMEERLKKYGKMNDELEKSNRIYKGFIDCMGSNFKKMFDEYVKQEAKDE